MSKKLLGTGLIPVELEVGGKSAAKRTQAFQQRIASGLRGNANLAGIRHMDRYLIPFFSSSASTTATGRRTIRLLLHFAICTPTPLSDLRFFKGISTDSWSHGLRFASYVHLAQASAATAPGP